MADKRRTLFAPPIRDPFFEGETHGNLTLFWVEFFKRCAAPGVELLEDTHANRANYTAARYKPGTLFYETDRQLYYVASGNTFRYIAGTMRDTFANRPTSLGTDDTGLLFFCTTGTSSTEYYHLFRWSGTAWEAAPGERLGGYVQHYVIAPIEKGWQLCNGTATKYLSISAGALAEVNFTPQDETAGIYRKSAAAYGAAVNPAVAPGITGTLGDAGSGSAVGVTVSGVTSGPSATTNVQSGAGTTVASSGHDHTFSGSGTGTVTDDHTHDATSLVVDDTGEPANVEYLPYFRR